MSGAMGLDVVHGVLYTVNDTHGKVQVEIFGIKVGVRRSDDEGGLGLRQARHQRRARCLITVQAHTCVDQSFAKREPQARCKVVAMQQQRFNGITRARIVELGVEDRLDRELGRRIIIT